MGFNNIFFNGSFYDEGPGTTVAPLLPLTSPLNQIVVDTSAEYTDSSGDTERRTVTHTLHLPSPPEAVVTYRSGPDPDAPTGPVESLLDEDQDTPNVSERIEALRARLGRLTDAERRELESLLGIDEESRKPKREADP